MLYSTNHNNSDPEITFNNEVIKPSHAYRCIRAKIDSNLNIENQPTSILNKMARAIRSLYLVRNKIYKNIRVDVFKPVVLSHLSFSVLFLQFLTQTKINRIDRQINWEYQFVIFDNKFCPLH